IRDLPGATAARKLVVSKALEHLDGLQADDTGDATLKLELATAYRRVGQIQGAPASPNLGDTKGALESYGKALALAEELVRREPGNRTYREFLGRTHNEISALFGIAGDTRAAEQHSRRGLAIVEELAARYPSDAALRGDLVRCYESLGDQVSSVGSLEEALS